MYSSTSIFYYPGERYFNYNSYNMENESAEQRLLHDILMSKEGCVTAEEALEEAKKR